VIRVDLERLKARAAEIAETEMKELLARTQESEKLFRRALKTLPNGVVSNFQAGDPYPVYLKHGKAGTVTDVDGNVCTDFHGGFGVNVVGHAHPEISKAIHEAADDAIHFAVTTEKTVELAEEICRRSSATRCAS
jgi:glutamate-1-semialdehyde 2,1-aminomutase